MSRWVEQCWSCDGGERCVYSTDCFVACQLFDFILTTSNNFSSSTTLAPMSLFLKEELTVAGHSLVVKERIAEGGFGFVDLVANPQTGQEFVVRLLSPPPLFWHCSNHLPPLFCKVKTMRNPKTRKFRHCQQRNHNVKKI
jgi:hypothetical protein